MSENRQIDLMSVEEYLAFEADSDQKHEFLNGRVFAMSGGKNAHNRIKARVTGSLFTQLQSSPCEALDSDSKVRIRTARKTIFYYPDAMVCCELTPDSETYQDRPVALVEVMSASTRRIDQGEKCDHYLSIESLQTYIMIDARSVGAIVYQRGSEGDFLQTRYKSRDDQISLPSIEANLRLSDLYRGVELDDDEQ